MNKTRAVAFVAAVIAAAAIVGGVAIFRNSSALTYECSLYFLNSSGTSLSPETRTLRYHNPDELPQKVIKALIAGPVNSSNSKIVDKHTDLLSLTNDGSGNYTADFSKDFLSDGDTTATSIYAVVKSLCALNDIASVQVTINGEMYQTAEGNSIGALTAEDINLATDTYSSETREVMLYFANAEGTKLSAEIRKVRVTDQQPLVQYVIEELIKGPEYEGHSSVLSGDTNLISVNVSNNVGFVNFGKTFVDKNTSSPEKDQLAIFAVVNSMTELDGVDRVQFLVDGKRVEKFGEIDISNPIGRNTDFEENG